MGSTVYKVKTRGEEWFIAKRMLDDVHDMGFFVKKVVFPGYYPMSIAREFGNEYDVKSIISLRESRLVLDWE